jgi:hypothetical protein
LCLFGTNPPMIRAKAASEYDSPGGSAFDARTGGPGSRHHAGPPYLA